MDHRSTSSTAFWANELGRRLAQPDGHMTPQEIAEIVQLIQVMKADGSFKHDPDYSRLLELMQRYSMAKQQPKSGPVNTSPTSRTAAVPPSAQPLSQPPNLSADQLATLKYQVAAYKHLSRNVPVPNELKSRLDAFSEQSSTSGSVPQKVAEAAAKHLRTKHSSATGGHSAAASPAKDHSYDGMDPYQHLKNGLYYGSHRLLLPSAMPIGLDPLAIAQERERQIRALVLQSISNLENLTASMPEEVPQLDENQAPEAAVSSKIKALIELKALRLLDKQKRLRAEVVAGMKRATMLQTAVSRSDYRRMKKPTLRELRHTEKMERQQRMEREKKERAKQIEYLNGILQHGRDMLAARRALSQKQMKLGRAVLHWHNTVEKEEQKRQERLTKERIKALKADDEEAYMKLIDKQKDTRLAHLLSQTDQYLDALSSLVLAQQEDIASRDVSSSGAVAVVPPPYVPPPVVEEDEDGSGPKIDYYSIAHRIHEPVSEQPGILVGGSLKEYQVKGLEWMVSLYNNKLNGILADEMGLGKTIQTISLIAYLIEKKNQNGPFLIIVPLSTITNWSLEFEKWAPSVVKVVYKGTPNQRREIQLAQMRFGMFNVLLTTYEYIIKDKSALSKIKWVHTIIDEGHRMKNASSKLSVTLTQYYSSRYRLILTGTPLQNNLPELWALLNFVLPKVFNSVKTFDEWFNTPFANTGERIELNEEEQLLIIRRLHKVLRPFLLRRLKKDVESDLPDKIERVMKTPLSALQQKIYNQIRQNGAMLVNTNSEKKYGVRSINNTIMQLRKVCNHPFVFEEVEDEMNPSHVTDEMIFRASGKFELLDRILPKLKATGHRVLIFFQMTAIMDIMEDYLRWRDHSYLRLDGSTKTEDRSGMLKLFNAPDSEYFAFILSTRAGGLGLNLQTADTVIIFDSDWNPHQDLQAQDRAHRIGQTKEVRIFRLISANSVEETILARAQYKLDIDGKVIQAGKFDNKSTNEEREQFLRSLFEANPEENEVDEVDDEEELNEILARSEGELEVFRKVDEQIAKSDLKWWKSKGRNGKPSRLVTNEELPEIYLREAIQEEKEEVVEMGRGRRQKTDVRYDDGLTDDQWARAVDREVDVEQLIEKKRRRAEKRALKRSQSGAEDDSTDDGGESSVPEASPRRPSKRSKTLDSGGETDVEEQLSAPASPTKSAKSRGRGRKSRSGASEKPVDATDAEDPLEPEVRQQLQSALEQLFEAMNQCTAPPEAEGAEPRLRHEIFIELPSRQLYPDYYKIIKKPIAMKTIEERINSKHYQDLKSFQADFNQMFKNAMTYNAEGSEVYEDAAEMKKALEREMGNYSHLLGDN